MSVPSVETKFSYVVLIPMIVMWFMVYVILYGLYRYARYGEGTGISSCFNCYYEETTVQNRRQGNTR